jgi:hypothetical protein
MMEVLYQDKVTNEVISNVIEEMEMERLHRITDVIAGRVLAKMKKDYYDLWDEHQVRGNLKSIITRRLHKHYTFDESDEDQVQLFGKTLQKAYSVKRYIDGKRVNAWISPEQLSDDDFRFLIAKHHKLSAAHQAHAALLLHFQETR